MLPSPVKTNKGWEIDVRPQGRYGPRIRRTFVRKMDAEKFIFDEFAKAKNGVYEAPTQNTQRLDSFIQQWFDLYGHTLKTADQRHQILQAMCRRMKNPYITDITPEFWLKYRRARMSDKTNVGTLITPNAINHEQAYLSAVFGTLIKLRTYTGRNPVQGVPKLKLGESTVTYLDKEQIKALLAESLLSESSDLYIRIKLCLSTGARWGEVGSLNYNDVRDGKVHYSKTKNATARAVPISNDLSQELLDGKSNKGLLFKTRSRNAFNNACERAGINLPRSQKTHVLRHTFATHFMINDGNILHLQKILGHKTLTMTMLYAKFAPSYLKDAETKNPLASL